MSFDPKTPRRLPAAMVVLVLLCGGYDIGCATGDTCDAGVCACPDGQVACDGKCVDNLVGCNTAVDVQGVVVFDGAPVAGVLVAIPGVGSTSTAVDGSFTLAGVTAPYDIGLSLPSSGRAIFFKGIRSAAPRLPFPFLPGPKLAASVSGALTGGESYPQPANHETDVCLDLDTSLGAPGGSPVAPGTFSVERDWWGGDVSAVLFGMQFARDPATDLPTDYVAFGKVEGLTLSAGAAITGQALPLESVGEATMSGTVVLPAGYAVSDKTLRLGCLRLLRDTSAGASFSYTTPSIPGAALPLEVDAQSATGRTTTRMTGLAPDATPVTVNVPAAPQLLAPAEGATLVDDATVFSWSEVPGGTAAVVFSDGGSTLLYVVTSDASTTLPASSLVGVPVPKATAMTWMAVGMAPLTIEEVVTRGSLSIPSDSSESASSERGFTSSP